MKPLSLAVLVSGGGTTLQNLLDRIADQTLPAVVQVVIGSRPGLQALQRAARAGVPNLVIDRSRHPDVNTFSREVFAQIDRAGVDLVCLAGWLNLLKIPDPWRGRVMNIHPALLPAFGGRGMYGLRVHEAVLAAGCKVSGCTVHFVDDDYDTGPIILQRTCPVHEGDSPQSLALRVFEQECLAYPQAIRLFQQGRLHIDGRRVRIDTAVRGV
ncbi:MAG: phosphoribosylglycinamide formyltransferase [Phycisphaerae bacterium]|nr:phosphoribosylglycinamide formyltransferase [Phycisphaerae bacterium]